MNIDLGNVPVGTPPSAEQREQLRAAIGGRALSIVTPTSAYQLPVPTGTFGVGDVARFHITPTGDQDLTLASGIVIPSDSAVVFPKTLEDGKLYIVQITYSGGFWMLTSLVGGYPTPS
jgi:hypothetical protein